FKPRPFWLSMALHSFVTDPEAPAAQLEHLERFLDTGRLDGLRSPQLRRSWFCRVEELEPLFASVGISRRSLLASSGVAAVWSRLETWRSMAGRGQELRHRLLELIRRTASDPHVLAMSDQVLFVGERDD
ncbi:MAG: hypothetical protein MI919_19550, partial [Holophagales bacterium]|nr:hypothetical protein [Holophagales bacterium]